MREQTGLVRRGAVWYFRRRIPKDLLQHYAGAREHFISLRTADRVKAALAARLRAVELDNEYAKLRAHAARATLSDEDIRRLSALYTAQMLAADEAARQQGLNGKALEKLAAQLDENAEDSGYVIRGKGPNYFFEARLDEFLARNKIDLEPDSDSYRKLYYEIAKADLRAIKLAKVRHEGEPVDTPEAPDVRHLSRPAPKALRGPKGPAAGSLNELRDYWASQKKPRPKTIIEADSVLRRFRDVNGSLAPAAVQRQHVIALRNTLVEQGRAPGTVKKLLGLLGGMFQVALEDDSRFGVENNPARAVKVRGALGEAKPRKPFSVEDLNAIFSSPVFTRGERPIGGAGDAAYWLPFLGLYTGARLNEIGQLRPEDVKTEGGITFIHFTDQGEGLRLKQGGKSRKRVPVHPEVVRLGFLRYVDKMKKAKSARLFPDLKPDRLGHTTGRWSKWFGRFLDEVGVKDPGKDFHSFRHTFKLAARECGIPEDQHDALTGHANASVARSYGSFEGYPLAPLAKAIRKLTYRGLNL
jgi:integrase